MQIAGRRRKFRAVPPESPVPSAAEAVLRFLDSLGRPTETEFYVRLFRKLPKESFAIIAPGAPVIRQATGALIEQLRFLADLGLFAPVVLGLFDPSGSLPLADRFARRFPSANLEPSVHDAAEPDLAERVREELRCERIPIVHFNSLDGETAEQRLARVAALSSALGTRKLVLLRRRGGLGTQSHRSIDLGKGHILPANSGGLSLINLRTERDPLLASKKLRKEDARLLEYVDALLGGPVACNVVVSVASPFNLLKELFTVKGAGTLIKRGTPIQRFSSYADLDVPRLGALLEASFGRTLDAGFFERAPMAVYLENDYRGAAILHASDVAPFLTKFAVEPEAQGEGIGQDLWQELVRDHRSVFWRARADNPINGWYVTLCDGMLRGDVWHVFWRGIEPARIGNVIAEALARPHDFSTAS